ncbi:tetratricopeptide (TPR) repeat protein [Azospirillum fermentarium]|uniref:hypothetical protein n=1 Tax=Azospirillum fermentarium TaxID=1233114 RepID=UPI002225F3AD|nr:hypothetical protein [Azospirillum fermentarium]MCW2245811.1 tetratricopeptide (TPR) repeat protein [Azospirillum fermentarium]
MNSTNKDTSKNEIDSGNILNEAIVFADFLIRAFESHKSKHYDLAEKFYRLSLIDNPIHYDALHLLGTLHHQTGRSQDGVRLIGRAIALGGERAEVLFNFANALKTVGRAEESLNAYRRALALKPDLHEAIPLLINLTSALAAERLNAHDPKGAGNILKGLADLPFDGDASFFGNVSFQLAKCGYPEESARMYERGVARDIRLVYNSPALSVAWLNTYLHREGGVLPRRPPALIQPKITTKLVDYGVRFGHSLLVYMTTLQYARKYGADFETPDWVGHYLFELDDPGLSDRPCMTDPDDIMKEMRHPYRLSGRAEILSRMRFRPVWRPRLAPALAELRRRGNTVVGLHYRHGDLRLPQYAHYADFMPKPEMYRRWLRNIWPSLDAPVLFVASDDVDIIRSELAEFKPLILSDLAPAWEGLEQVQDFYILMHSDIVMASESTFSRVAAALNVTARLVVEPDIAGACFRPYNPWSEA